MFEKHDTHHKTVIAILAILMIVFTGVNMAFSYFIVADKVQQNALEREYNNYGGKEDYEKAMILLKAQTKLQMAQSQFIDKSVDEVQKEVDSQVEQAIGSMWTPVDSQPNGNVENYKIEKDLSMFEWNIKDGRYILGPTDAKISIYEFSDISCPFCRQLHNSDVKEKLFANYKGDVNFTFKNFPIPQLHPQAHLQSVAALCLADQTQNALDYYKYLDGEFNSGAKSKDELTQLATGNFDIDKAIFSSCLDSGKFDELIQADQTEGANYGVRWTPGSVIVNNETGEIRLIKGAAQYPSFRAAIDELLK